MMKKMLIALMVIITAALVIMPGAASDYVNPVVVEDNPACDDLNCSWVGYKIDQGPPYDESYEIDGIGSVSIEMVNEYCFDFTSSGVLIYGVIVKGGPNANVYNYYEYAEPVTADTMICPPWNENSGTYYDISHIEFCYEEWIPTPTPTPTPTPVPEFPFYVPTMMAVFGVAMGAVVISLGRRQ